MADHQHIPTVHLCNPPDGHPYLVICQACNLVMWGEVTQEQRDVPDTHPTLTQENIRAYVAPIPESSTDPDHILDGLTCWCRPYRDPSDPETIWHRREARG